MLLLEYLNGAPLSHVSFIILSPFFDGTLAQKSDKNLHGFSCKGVVFKTIKSCRKKGCKGASITNVDWFLWFFEPPPPLIDLFIIIISNLLLQSTFGWTPPSPIESTLIMDVP